MVLAWFGISIISMRFIPIKLKDITSMYLSYQFSFLHLKLRLVICEIRNVYYATGQWPVQVPVWVFFSQLGRPSKFDRLTRANMSSRLRKGLENPSSSQKGVREYSPASQLGGPGKSDRLTSKQTCSLYVLPRIPTLEIFGIYSI